MSKYNHIKSIPIDSIPKEEIMQAIKEWAEGDDAMETLLLSCYNKGIKTAGCHAGARPYISFVYQDNLERLIPIFEATQKEKGSQIIIMTDGGNPFSGPEWYLPTIGVGLDTEYKEEADIYFDKLTDSLEKENSNKDHYLLRLLEFLVDKESALTMRFRHTMDDKFSFFFESSGISEERYNYYKEIFSKAGLIVEEKTENLPPDYHGWMIESDNLDDILSKLDYAADYIISNYSLDIPKSEDEILNFKSRALFKRRTLSEKEFNDWILSKKIEFGMIPKNSDDSKENEELNTMLDYNEEQNNNSLGENKQL